MKKGSLKTLEITVAISFIMGHQQIQFDQVCAMGPE